MKLKVGNNVFEAFRLEASEDDCYVIFNDDGACFCAYNKFTYEDWKNNVEINALFTSNYGESFTKLSLDFPIFDNAGHLIKTMLTLKR